MNQNYRYGQLWSGRKAFFFFLMWLPSVVCLYADNPRIDSLKNVALHASEIPQRIAAQLTLCEELKFSNGEMAKCNCEKALEMARAYGSDSLMAASYLLRAQFEFLLGERDLSLSYTDSANSIFQKMKDTLGLVSAYDISAKVFRENGNCVQGINTYLAAMELTPSIEDSGKALKIYHNYAEALWMCQQYEEALKHGKEGLHKASARRDKAMHQLFLMLLGSIYYQLEIDDSCVYYYKKSLEVSRSLNNPYILSSSLHNLGLIYIYTGNFAESESLLNASAAIDRKHNFSSHEASTFVNLAILYSFQEKHKKAGDFYEKGIDLLKKGKRDIHLQAIYQSASLSYFKAQNFSKAFEYQHLSYVLGDSLHSAEIQGAIKELDAKYQNERVKKRLFLTRLENNKQTLKTIRTIAMWIGLSILLFFIYLFTLSYFQSRKAKEEKRRIQLEYSVLQAQMNPHFIFNSLNSIQAYFADNDFEQGNEYLGAFGELIRKVMEQSSHERISLAEELQTLHLYLQLEQLRLQSMLSFEMEIDERIVPDHLLIPPLILQPFVENAIWHGIVPKKEAGKLTLSIRLSDKSEGLVLVTIRDDGVGLQRGLTSRRGKNHQSKGIKITRERLGINGDIHVQEWLDKHNQVGGTEVHLTIPFQSKTQKQ